MSDLSNLKHLTLTHDDVVTPQESFLPLATLNQIETFTLHTTAPTL